jgi:hypothetical protein
MVRSATLTPSAPLVQGVSSPQVVVSPNDFFPATRRLRYPMKSLTSIAGLGSTDSVQLRQTGIVVGLEVRVTGTVVWGGTITGSSTTWSWPYDLVRAFRLSANGQSNLVNYRGMTARVLEFTANPRLDDAGVAQKIGAVTPTFGTLSLPCDDLGTSGANLQGINATVPATGTYTVDITYFIPVAADYTTLVGAVYAQSSATNLTLDIDWNTQANLVVVGGAATFAQALQYSVTGQVFSIPNVGGAFVVPDLSQFHQLAEYRAPGLGQGVNEPVLPGTGVGRRLLRALFQTWSGATPAPLAMNATNYSTVGWAYGGSDVPEAYANGTNLRALNIRQVGTDIGGQFGFGLWDFANVFAVRDSVDEGATSDLRLQIGLVNAPTSGFAQICQETLFAAPVGA